MEALKFSSTDLRELAEHFEAISQKVPLSPINSDREYDFAVRALNALLDAGAADESHNLASLAETLGEFKCDGQGEFAEGDAGRLLDDEIR